MQEEQVVPEETVNILRMLLHKHPMPVRVQSELVDSCKQK
jgi:hypothetical protein